MTLMDELDIHTLYWRREIAMNEKFWQIRGGGLDRFHCIHLPLDDVGVQVSLTCVADMRTCIVM